MKTYLWIKETPNSTNVKSTITKNSRENVGILLTTILDSKLNMICPATILAVKRTVKVKGRKNNLIVSITAITSNSLCGVPKGTNEV